MKPRIIGILAIAVAIVASLVYGGVLVRHGFSARDEPSRVEAWSARRIRMMAIPSEARRLANPIPQSPESIREGMQHFADHCATCHANNGSGATEIGRNLYPKAPDMRAGDTQDLSDGELYYIIENGIRLSGMPAWGKSNEPNDEESWKLVHFIRHLPSLTSAEDQMMKQWNPVSPQEKQSESEEDEFLSGSEGTAPHKH